MLDRGGSGALPRTANVDSPRGCQPPAIKISFHIWAVEQRHLYLLSGSIVSGVRPGVATTK